MHNSVVKKDAKSEESKIVTTAENNNDKVRIIGVIGGVGPYAGLDFVRYIFDNTLAVKDQEHLSTVLVSCPVLVPDRTGYLLSGAVPALAPPDVCKTPLDGEGDKTNPAYGMFSCAKMLYAAGARLVTVACNTAHAAPIFGLYKELVTKELPGLEVVNMLEACAVYVKTQLGFTRIGLLATKGTHASRVYHEYFQTNDGFTLVEPTEEEREAVHDAIYNATYGIKAQSSPVTSRVKKTLEQVVASLAARGAQAVVLGCTELPLAVGGQEEKMKEGVDASVSVPLLNPAWIVARRLVALVAPEKLVGVM